MLQARIKGKVVVRSDEDYEIWRESMIWQRAKADRAPDMIVQADTIEDVREAVNYARAHKLRTTTRCGGHSMAACFLRNGGMLIDISRLDGIEVDKSAKEAIVGPGVITRGLAERLLLDGLAFPGAHCGTVPISGFLLGGGVGLNSNAWAHGASVFAVKGVDIVTADGELRHASADENPDLFWAVRGGGPGLFGVVVRFYLQCFDAPTVIFGATYTFPYAEFEAVVAVMNEVAPKLDKDVEVLCFATADAAAPEDAPVEERQKVYLDVNAFVANADEGRRKLAALSQHPLMQRAVAKDIDRIGSYDRYYGDNEASFSQTYWMGDSIWVDDALKATEILKRNIPDCPAPKGTPLLLYRGEGGLPDAAFSRIGRFYCAYYLEWDLPQQEAASRAYCLKVYSELKSISKGNYINEMDQEGRPQDIPECFSPAAWGRLGELRSKWDPGRLFHDFYGRS
ncbi:MAG: FAD-binding oxidoreductase [Novosphingobium sp.]